MYIHHRSQRGSAILIAMIASIVIGIIVSLIMEQNQHTETSTRSPRVKSAMANVESQLLAAAYDGTLFVPCAVAEGETPTPNCRQVNPTVAQNLKVQVPGSQCSGAFCGIEVKDAVFNEGTKTLTAEIVYHGEELAIAPIKVSSVVSLEAWQSQTSQCDLVTEPLLVGFDASGNKICRALPGDCGVGEYMTSFDPMSVTGTAARTCAPLSGAPSCPPGTFISTFQWFGGPSFSVGCQAVLNPFAPAPDALGDGTLYSYEVASLSAAAPWPDAPAPPTPPPPPPPPPPSGTCTWSCTAATSECTPGPAAGCSYGQYLAATGDPDRRGESCATAATKLMFQRTGPSITCDVGWLICDCL